MRPLQGRILLNLNDCYKHGKPSACLFFLIDYTTLIKKILKGSHVYSNHQEIGTRP